MTKAVEEQVDETKEDEFQDNDLYLTAEENLSLLLSDARIKNMELDLRLKKAEFELMQMRNIRDAALNDLALLKQKIQLDEYQKALLVEQNQENAAMMTKRTEIEERLEIGQMEDYAYCPETGKLTKLPE